MNTPSRVWIEGGTSLLLPDLKKVFVYVQKVPVKEIGQGCSGLVALVSSQRVGLAQATSGMRIPLTVQLAPFGYMYFGFLFH